MKKIHISTTLAIAIIFLAICFFCLPTSAQAAEVIDSGTCGVDGDNLLWSLDDEGTLTISGTGEMQSYTYSSPAPWYENMENIRIADVKHGVTSIGSYAFYNNSSLNSVNISDSVTSIGNDAFRSCISLTSVTIPDSITSVGDYAFDECSSLACVVIQEGVESIGRYAFCECRSLESVVIPDSVKKIGDHAFSRCSGLTSAIVGDGVFTVSEYAFYMCGKLKEITFGKNVKRFEYRSFYGCYALSDVYITDPSAWCEVKCSSSPTDHVMYNAEFLHILDEDGNEVTNFILDETVYSISAYSFRNCKNLTNITIPDSVTSIGAHAFDGCSSLIEISLPSKMTGLSEYVFSYCSGLISVVIPESISSIGDCAFYGNSSLKYAYYTGSQEQWDAITVGLYNDSLTAENLFCNMRYVTFKNWDGTIIDNGMIQQDATIVSKVVPTKEADNTYTYTFSGWDQAVCTSDMEVTAQYTATYIDYTVSFCDWAGTLLQSESYHWGDPITVPTDVPRYYDDTYYYEFSGWDSSVSTTCDGNKTYTAVYKQKTRTMPVTPGEPILKDRSASVLVLQATDNCEYSKDGILWQDSNVFTGLTEKTEYTFYQRVKETVSNLASQSSPALRVKTLQKTEYPVKPAKPIVADYSYNRIELIAREGYEYRINDDIWTTNPIFTGLQENTSYTVYQRVAETGECYASEVSEGVVVTTDISGENSVDYYWLLRQYISENATSSNSKKLQISESNYTYSLTNQNEGVTFALVRGKTGSSGFEITTHFTIYPDSKNINVYCMMTYFSSGSVMDMASDTIYLDRSSYTPNTTLTATESGFLYISSSDLSEYATLTMKILCAFWDRELYSELGLGIDCLGFVSYYGLSNAVCDPASGYHSGTSKIRNQREAGCVIDGNSGDYYCSVCKEKLSSGNAIPAIGSHSFVSACDKTCDICEEERIVADTMSVHCYEDVVTPPTCTAQGYTAHTCVCGDSYVDSYVSSSDHSFTNYISNNDATYDTDGTKTAKCDRCETTDTIADPGTKLTAQNGWKQIDGKWYYYQNGQKVVNQWRKDSSGWCWLTGSGAMATNQWVKDSKGWCYIGANGYCWTNRWAKDSIGWIWLDSEGSMTKSKWVKDGGKWYYLNADGYMVTNQWRKDSAGWCWLTNSGAMATNQWVKDSKGWCYVGANGYCWTNRWAKDSTGWIWLDGEGSMTKSQWLLDGGKWYYLNANGYMVTGTVKIGNTIYNFASNGVWIP